MLPLDIQVELFNRLIVPVLLCGCEVWCPMMTNLAPKLLWCPMITNQAAKLRLRFYKIILKLGKSTATCMVYGELYGLW